MEYKKVEEIVSSVQVDLGYSTSRNTNILKRYIYEAIQDMGCAKLLLKSVKLDLDNLEKPQDYVSAKTIYLVKGDTKVEPYYSEAFTCPEPSNACDPRYYVSETRDSFYFNEVGDYQCVHLIYYATPTLDGKPAVPFKAWQGIYWYCMWKDEMLSRKKNKHKAARQNPSSMNEIALYLKNYEDERFKFQSWLTSPSNARQVSEIGEFWIYGRNDYPPGLMTEYQNFLNK